MDSNLKAKVLRIYISNTDKFKHDLLYEVIVFAAKRDGLAGATVIKGIMGFGPSSVIHSVRFWEVTEKVPVIVEIVDEADKVEMFSEKIISWFEKIRYGCMITIEDTNVLLYKRGSNKVIK